MKRMKRSAEKHSAYALTNSALDTGLPLVSQIHTK